MERKKLSSVKISYPEIVHKEDNGDGYESYTLRYKIDKGDHEHFAELSNLILKDYFEIEYFSLTGKLPDFASLPKSILMIPAFNFFFPLTFFWPINLKLGEIDADASKSVEAFRDSIAKVYSVEPEVLRCGEISTGHVAQNSKNINSQKRLVMFSGGVDSYCNIAHNYKDMMLGSVEGLEATRGRNTNTTEPAMLRKRSEMKRLAMRLNTQAVILKIFPYIFLNQELATSRMKEIGIMSVSNGHDYVRDTVLYIPVISMYAPYMHLIGLDISVGSTYEPVNEYQRIHKLSGQRDCTNPDINNALRFCGHGFMEQDGLHQMRTDKLNDIMEFDRRINVGVRLIVCFSETGENCHECKKCIRTQLNLLALDEDPRKWNFNKFSPSRLMSSMDKLDYTMLDKESVFDVQYRINSSVKYKIMNEFLQDFKRKYDGSKFKNSVSILTPCYNGEKYISRLLDSVFAQVYPKINMTVIDDGSTDGSADIIKAYIPKFASKGYKLEYIYQKNQGQSVAINNGLKLVNSKYLVWPDADDSYASSDAISQMVEALEGSGNDTSMVRVQYNVLDESGNTTSGLGVSDETRYKTDLFEDAVFGANGFWYPPGGIMAKMSKIDKLIPGREIYTEKNAGQNFQLYLPLLYNQKCLTLEKYLYNIVEHEDSHSRNMATSNSRQKVYYRTIKNTLDKIPLPKDYRKHLMKGVRTMTQLGQIQSHGRRYRTYIKRIIKGVLPYGLIMLYKRRRS